MPAELDLHVSGKSQHILPKGPAEFGRSFYSNPVLMTRKLNPPDNKVDI